VGSLEILGYASDPRYVLVRDFHTGDDTCGCPYRRHGGACDPGKPAVTRVLATEAREWWKGRAAMIPRPWGTR